MKYHHSVPLLAALAAVPPTYAQEALRNSLAGEEAARARRARIENQVHNIEAGPVDLLLRAGFGVEYNSNVRYSNEDRKDDFILRPMLWADAHLPVSEVNALHVSFGVGYAAYMKETDLSYFVFQPGSEIAFDLFVEDFRFTFYNRISYTLDPSLNGAISDTGRYGGLSNIAGVDGLWDLNDLILRLGYGFEIFRSDVSDWDYLDRDTHLVPARADVILNDMWTVGPEVTFSSTTYRQPILPESTGASAGAYAEARLSEYVTTSAHAGYVYYDFDPPGEPLTEEDLSTWYARLDWRHRLNKWLTYTVSGGREVQLGIYSYYELYWFARWIGDWTVLKKTSLRTSIGYEDGEQPPQAYDQDGSLVLLFGQDYERFRFDVQVGRELLPRLEAQLGYRFYYRLGDTTRNDYTQHAVTLGAAYQF